MKIKNILIIFTILVIIITTLSVFKTNSKAATYLIEEADLYSKEN